MNLKIDVIVRVTKRNQSTTGQVSTGNVSCNRVFVWYFLTHLLLVFYMCLNIVAKKRQTRLRRATWNRTEQTGDETTKKDVGCHHQVSCCQTTLNATKTRALKIRRRTCRRMESARNDTRDGSERTRADVDGAWWGVPSRLNAAVLRLGVYSRKDRQLASAAAAHRWTSMGLKTSPTTP